MGKRYLMRLGKTPFEAVDGFQTLDRNTIGRNNGNLIFGAASHKLFSTADTVVEANRYKINKSMADEVNSDYDGFVLPLANAFRPGFESELLRTTEFIERLKMPFLMLSGGAQLPLDGDPTGLKQIEPTVRRFARAVLEKSSALTVRGELTADYLKSLGFKDVLVVGCPSMTMNGRGHRVEKADKLEPGSKIAYNVQTTNPFAGELIDDADRRFDATYMPQDSATLELMLWGTSPYTSEDSRLPLDRIHRQFAEGRAEFQLDASTWIRRMRDTEFSFGPRIHGNIAAILAGTPAIVLAHDGRTLELSRYHGVPSADLNTDPCPTSVEEAYGLADFTEFNRGHAERFDRLSDFLHENGFNHIYDAGQEDARHQYEKQLSATRFPDPQKPLWSDAPSEFVRMTAVLRQYRTAFKKAGKNSSLAAGSDYAEMQIASMRARLESAEKRVEQIEAKLAKTQSKLAEVRNKASRVDARLEKLLRIPLGMKRVLTPRDKH